VARDLSARIAAVPHAREKLRRQAGTKLGDRAKVLVNEWRTRAQAESIAISYPTPRKARV